MPASVRSIIGAVVAVPIAVGLFYIMTALVSRDFQQEETKARKIADIVVPDKVIETNLKEVLPEKVEDLRSHHQTWNRCSLIPMLI